MKTVANTARAARAPTPAARPTASVDSMTPASFGIVDLRAVAHQPRGADDAERARETGADDEHHDSADDREDDLRLDDGRLPLRRALPARPERQHAREARRDRQPRRAHACQIVGSARSAAASRSNTSVRLPSLSGLIGQAAVCAQRPARQARREQSLR